MSDKQALVAAEVGEIAGWVRARAMSHEPVPMVPEPVAAEMLQLVAGFMPTLAFVGPLVMGLSVGNIMFEAGRRYGLLQAAQGNEEGERDGI